MFLTFPKIEVRFFLRELNLLDEGEFSVVGELELEGNSGTSIELVVGAFLLKDAGIGGVAIGSATFLPMVTVESLA